MQPRCIKSGSNSFHLAPGRGEARLSAADEALPGGRAGIVAVCGGTIEGARDICFTGTLITGTFGSLVLTRNSTCWPGGAANPCGNPSWAMKNLPGCSSLISTPTPGTLTVGSDSLRRFVVV